MPYIQGIWIVYRFDIDDVTIMNCGQHTFSADADRDFFSLRQRLERCPRFGNGDAVADEIARELSAFVFGEFGRYAPWRGGRFLPSCLMFTTYANVGLPIGALPDGRLAGEPVADSAGAHQGRDVHGPTALLNSVVCLDHRHAAGTLVVNIRLSKNMFATAESRDKIKALVRGYFEMGGMQIQLPSPQQFGKITDETR